MDPRYENSTREREDALSVLSENEDVWRSTHFMQWLDTGGCCKSLKWPGAIAVAPVQCALLPVGYGSTSVPVTYTPPILPSLQSENAASLTEQFDIVEAPVETQEDEED